MLDWIKYFGLNFFSKKYADESKTRKLWNGVLAFLIAVVVMYGAYCGMAIASFPVHYDNSAGFKAYYNGLFEGENSIAIEIKDGKAAYIEKDASSLVINTFVNEADREKYAKDGYNVVVDMRDGRATYNDCTVQFVNGDLTISYDEYMELGEAKQSEYSPKLVMSERSLELTAEKIADYIAFISTNGDDDAKQSLEALKTNGVVIEENYGAVYELYYKVKYSGFGNSFASAPTMRNYYTNTYLATDDNGRSVYDNYVILLEDIAFASWHTDSGQMLSVAGYYGNENIIINAEGGADELILDLYNANTYSLAINYLLYMVRAIFTLCFVWLLLPMFMSVIGVIAKYNTLANYSAMAKTMGGFWFGSLIPTLLFIVIASFFMSQTYVFYIGIAILLATDIIRTIIHYVPLMAEEKKKKLAEKEKAQAELVNNRTEE